jgi:TPR repeat protein
MARNIRLTPYDEQMIDAFDEDASDPQYTAYGSSAPPPTETYFPPDDTTMPLFLSDDPEPPRQRGFGTGRGGNRETAAAWPRILKVGIFTASAAAIAFAVVSVENPLALFANAKASLNGTSPGQASPPVKAASEPTVKLASAEPTAPAVQTNAGTRTSLPAATNTPTRDEIAAALRNAHQSQAEIRQPPAVTVAPVAVAPVAVAPVAAAAPPARHLAPDELAALLKRAEGLIEVGDIAPARLLLERAADAQEPSAALLLAQTYDPAVLGALDMRSITPDPAMARNWYQKAAQFGSLEAQQRLARMQN